MASNSGYCRLPVAGASVEFDAVTVTLGGVRALDAVNASVPAGGCTAVVGPNGAGKTTLLMALLGEIPFEGRIRVTCPHGGAQPRIGYVPQRLAFDRGMPLTVTEFLALALQRRPLWLGVSGRHKPRIAELLEMVGASGLAARPLGALSGGELQRALLALALAQEPELLLLDEPAAGVDFQGEHLFCELLDHLRAEKGFTQLMVSHDLATVTHHATHVICLNRRVAAQGPPLSALTPETLTAIYGIHMGLVDSRKLPEGRGDCTAPCCSGRPHD